MKRGTERSISALTAEIIWRVWLSPDTYTVPVLAAELGEAERRVQRTLAEIDGNGWAVERGADWRLTIKPAISPAAAHAAEGYVRHQGG